MNAWVVALGYHRADRLKDGLDYTEWLVEQVNEGLAELDSGREMSWADLEAEIAIRRTARAGKPNKAA